MQRSKFPTSSKTSAVTSKRTHKKRASLGSGDGSQFRGRRFQKHLFLGRRIWLKPMLEQRGLQRRFQRGFWASCKRRVARFPWSSPSRRKSRARTAPVCAEWQSEKHPRIFGVVQAVFPSRARFAARTGRDPGISSCSNSAIEAKIPNTSRPLGVLVSTPSWRETKSIPASGTLRAR